MLYIHYAALYPHLDTILLYISPHSSRAIPPSTASLCNTYIHSLSNLRTISRPSPHRPPDSLTYPPLLVRVSPPAAARPSLPPQCFKGLIDYLLQPSGSLSGLSDGHLSGWFVLSLGDRLDGGDGPSLVPDPLILLALRALRIASPS